MPGFNTEYEALKEAYKKKQSELADVITERDELINTIVPNLQAIYINKLGEFHQLLMELEIEERTLRYKLSLAQEYLNRQEFPDLEEIANKVERAVEEWTIEVENYRRQRHAARVHFDHALSDKESLLLSVLYRKLVKALHPDINPDFTEESRELWERTLEAYRLGDLGTLLDIERSLEDKEIILPAAETGFEVVRERIELLRKQIDIIQKEIEKKRKEFPMVIEYVINNPKWVADKRNELMHQADNKKAIVQFLTDRYNMLVMQTN
jgi:hypothetical protein